MRYAWNYQDGWTVFEAPVGVEVGQGTIVASGLTEEKMEALLNETEDQLAAEAALGR